MLQCRTRLLRAVADIVLNVVDVVVATLRGSPRACAIGLWIPAERASASLTTQ